MPPPIKGQFIAQSVAETMIDDFKKDYPNGHNSAAFSKEYVQTIFAQSGCEYLRVYFGVGEDNKITAILVGSDENDYDILGSSNSILEFGDHSNPNPLK